MIEKRPHVLAVSYLFPNSIYPHYGVFVLNRLKAIQKYCDITVINPIPYFPFTSSLQRYKSYNLIPKEENIGGIKVYHPRFFSIPKFYKSLESTTYPLAVLPLAKRINAQQPVDLIDLHWTYPDLPAGKKLSRLINKKFLVTLRGVEAFHIAEQDHRLPIIKSGLKEANHVISLSNELKNLGIKYGATEAKSTVIRNGVDTEAFCFQEQGDARDKLKLGKNKKIILSTGSLIHRKGFDRVIKHLPTVLKQHPNTHFYIIGSKGPEGNYESQLINLIEERNLLEHVHFVGTVKNEALIHWYNAADLFCLMSRGEGSPNVLTEALACGCPSLSSNVGSVPEIMDEEIEMGAVIPNDDQHDFSTSITDCLSSTYDRKAISNLMKRYNWDWCARKVIDVYDGLES